MAAAFLVVEHELRRRQRIRVRQDRPLHVVEVEDRLDRDQVHVRVVVGVERPDVAPVALVARRRARHLVEREVVDLGLAALDEHGHDRAAHVVLGRLVGGVLGDRVDQRLGGEDVVAHRREDLLRRVGQPDRVGRLLAEGADRAPVGGRLDHPELVGLRQRRAQGGDGHRGPARDVLVDHLLGVHAVDVVGAEDDHVLRLLVAQQVEVLVDRRPPSRRTSAGRGASGPEPARRSCPAAATGATSS